jgi:hypothetical protein
MVAPMNTTTAPLIYVRTRPVTPMPVMHRLIALGVAMGALSVLLVAAWMKPAPGGVGTHQQLGMRPCEFLERTKLPCAACGMTTSFAHLVRGDLPASLYAQPFGCLLAVATAMAVSIGLYAAVTGRAAYAPLAAMGLKTHLWLWAPMALAAWGWKIVVVVSGWG